MLALASHVVCLLVEMEWFCMLLLIFISGYQVILVILVGLTHYLLLPPRTPPIDPHISGFTSGETTGASSLTTGPSNALRKPLVWIILSFGH